MELLERISASDTSAHVPGCARCMADVVSGLQVFICHVGVRGWRGNVHRVNGLLSPGTAASIVHIIQNFLEDGRVMVSGGQLNTFNMWKPDAALRLRVVCDELGYASV